MYFFLLCSYTKFLHPRHEVAHLVPEPHKVILVLTAAAVGLNWTCSTLVLVIPKNAPQNQTFYMATATLVTTHGGTKAQWCFVVNETSTC